MVRGAGLKSRLTLQFQRASAIRSTHLTDLLSLHESETDSPYSTPLGSELRAFGEKDRRLKPSSGRITVTTGGFIDRPTEREGATRATHAGHSLHWSDFPEHRALAFEVGFQRKRNDISNLRYSS